MLAQLPQKIYHGHVTPWAWPGGGLLEQFADVEFSVRYHAAVFLNKFADFHRFPATDMKQNL